MGQSLYEISNDHIELMQSIEDSEGVLTPEMETALELNEANLQVKAKGYVEIIKTKDALDLAVDIEIKRLQALKKRNGKVIDTLKERLLGAVILFGDFEVGLVKFSTRKSTSVNIINSDEIPKKLMITKVSSAPDKTAIKSLLKSGVDIEGCELINKQNLAIK